MINEILKLLVGKGVVEFAERIRQSPVVPLVVFGVFGMEKVPQSIALQGIVTGDCSHIRELVAESHDLGIA